jgi:hypothetical protein
VDCSTGQEEIGTLTDRPVVDAVADYPSKAVAERKVKRERDPNHVTAAVLTKDADSELDIHVMTPRVTP